MSGPKQRKNWRKNEVELIRRCVVLCSVLNNYGVLCPVLYDRTVVNPKTRPIIILALFISSASLCGCVWGFILGRTLW
jgi:hypothetical protein